MSQSQCPKCKSLIEFIGPIPPICPDCNLMVGYPPCEECGSTHNIKLLRDRAFCLDCIMR